MKDGRGWSSSRDYPQILKPLAGPVLSQHVLPPIKSASSRSGPGCQADASALRFLDMRFANLIIYALVLAGIAVFLVISHTLSLMSSFAQIIDTADDRSRLVSSLVLRISCPLV